MKEENVYMASIEFYVEPETDSKESEGIEFIVIATSFKEAELKVLEAVGEENVKHFWSISFMEGTLIK